MKKERLASCRNQQTEDFGLLCVYLSTRGYGMFILDALERRFGRFAIPGLVRYIAVAQIGLFLLIYINPALAQLLALDFTAVTEGEVWRLITGIVSPGSDRSIMWAVFVPLFMMFVSDGLEAHLGPFRVNVLIGVYILLAWGLAFGEGTLSNVGMEPVFLFSNLLLMLCALAPRYEIMLLGIVPLQLRWLGCIQMVGLAAQLHFLPPLLLAALWHHLPVIALLVLLRKAGGQHRNRPGRSESVSKKGPAFNTCSVCGRTDISDPELDFRSDGNGVEFCEEHLPK